jgi:hypothetical protein
MADYISPPDPSLSDLAGQFRLNAVQSCLAPVPPRARLEDPNGSGVNLFFSLFENRWLSQRPEFAIIVRYGFSTPVRSVSRISALISEIRGFGKEIASGHGTRVTRNVAWTILRKESVDRPGGDCMGSVESAYRGLEVPTVPLLEVPLCVS